MEPSKTMAKSVGELHRGQQQRACTGDSMWQQPPLKGFVVLPPGILRMHQKTLIVNDDVDQHECQDGKQQVLWAHQWKWFYSSRES
jgi:hypothetical protein